MDNSQFQLSSCAKSAVAESIVTQPVLARTLRNLFSGANPAPLLVPRVQVAEGLAWLVLADELLSPRLKLSKRKAPRKQV
jgi:hypothetical protein